MKTPMNDNFIISPAGVGKTSMALAYVADRASERPNTLVHILTYNVAMVQVEMGRLRNIIGDRNINRMIHSPYGEIVMINGSVIRFIDGNHPEVLRGVVQTPDIVIVDNADLMDKEAIRQHYLVSAPEAVVWWLIQTNRRGNLSNEQLVLFVDPVS